MNKSRVEIRLKELLEEKGITLYRIEKDTGIAYTTLLKMKQKKNKSINLVVLASVCDYLKCAVSDLLVLESGKKK